MAVKGKVLIVDDDDTTLVMLKVRLKKVDGYQVELASNGKQGVELAVEKNPNLILLDWDMPIMTGVEALKELQLQRKTAEIPVIMLTARGKMADVEMALALGAVDYVTKPVDFTELSRKLDRYVAED